MRNVHVRRIITLSLTADDWALYSYDNDGALMTEQRDAAAREINRVAEAALNSLTITGAKAAIEEVLRKHEAIGADDTEGRTVMYELLTLIVGENK